MIKTPIAKDVNKLVTNDKILLDNGIRYIAKSQSSNITEVQYHSI